MLNHILYFLQRFDETLLCYLPSAYPDIYAFRGSFSFVPQKNILFSLFLFLFKLFFLSFQNLFHKSPPKLSKSFDSVVTIFSANQLNSLSGYIHEATQKQKKILIVTHNSLLSDVSNSLPRNQTVIPLCLGFHQLVPVLVLLLLRLPRLISMLSKHEKSSVLLDSAANYFHVYLWVTFAFNLFAELTPTSVVFSNDHSTISRCFNFVARHLKFQTVYVQHASISHRFPPLFFDLVLLDGQYSLDIYSEIFYSRPSYPNYDSKIFLTGSQFTFTSSSKLCINENVIGIALKPYDDLLLLRHFIDSLSFETFNILIRPHPASSPSFLSELTSIIDTYPPNITISTASSLQLYLSSLTFLISGHSGIHLNAALLGLPTFLYEFNSSDIGDYYRYLEKHLTIPLTATNFLADPFSFLQLKKFYKPDPAILQYYSSSFNTYWQNQEPLLMYYIIHESQSHNLLFDISTTVSPCYENVLLIKS